jgi:uncharacterized Zn finger protein (UPF0148 family)
MEWQLYRGRHAVFRMSARGTPERKIVAIAHAIEAVLSRDACPECGTEELRPDVTTGETDCVNCGWSEACPR